MGCILKTLGIWMLMTAGAAILYIVIRYADWEKLREQVDPIINSPYFLWGFGFALFIGFVLTLIGDELDKPKSGGQSGNH